jgi:hypothetical protein
MDAKRERFSCTSPERKKLKIKRESIIFISASFVPSLSWLDTANCTPSVARPTSL